MTIHESIGLVVLAWLAIGACALPFVGRFFHLADRDDVDDLE